MASARSLRHRNTQLLAGLKQMTAPFSPQKPDKKPAPKARSSQSAEGFRAGHWLGRIPGLSFHLLILAAILLCISLGFWQLERAKEKEHLLEQIRLGRSQPLMQEDLEAQLWNAATGAPTPLAILAPYSQYQVYGIYDPDRSLLLDNRTHEGRVGYHLLTPFRLLGSDSQQSQSPHWILINRGWIEAPRLRSELPVFDTPLLPVTLQIQARALKEDLPDEALNLTWPVRVQQLSPSQLSNVTGHFLPAYEFRLSDTRQPGVAIPQPVSLPMRPEQHVGYSVQWFALALTFTLMWSRPLWWRRKRRQRKPSDH